MYFFNYHKHFLVQNSHWLSSQEVERSGSRIREAGEYRPPSFPSSMGLGGALREGSGACLGRAWLRFSRQNEHSVQGLEMRERLFRLCWGSRAASRKAGKERQGNKRVWGRGGREQCGVRCREGFLASAEPDDRRSLVPQATSASEGQTVCLVLRGRSM